MSCKTAALLLGIMLMASCSESTKSRTEGPASVRIGSAGDYARVPLLPLTVVKPLCEDEFCGTTAEMAVTDTKGNTLLWEMGQQLMAASPAVATPRTIGRLGGGPGEYRALVGAGFTPSGELLALDAAQQRLLTYDSVGAPLRTAHVDIPPGYLAARFAGGRLIVVSTLLDEAKNDSAPVGILSRAPGASGLRETGKLPVRAAAYSMGDLRPIPTPFEARSLWAIGTSGRIAYTRGDSLMVTVYDTSGAALLRFGFEIAPRKVTDLEVQRERERRLKGIGDPQMRAALQGHSATPPERHPAITDLRELENGDTWLREAPTESGDSARWIAFDSTGTALGAVTLSTQARVLSAWQGLVLVGYLDGGQPAQWMRMGLPE